MDVDSPSMEEIRLKVRKLTPKFLGGTIVALYPAPLAQVRMRTQSTLVPGMENTLVVSIEDLGGVPVAGLQPLRLDITNAEGTNNAYSGYYCAQDGVLRLPIVPGLNEAATAWKIKAEDLTAGLVTEYWLNIADPVIVPEPSSP